MSGGGSRDWRGGRRRREKSQQVGETSVPAWKQSRQPRPQAPSRRRVPARVILPSLALVILVVLAISMWLIPKPHYTHVNVFNPLTDSETFSAAATPEFPETPEGLFPLRRMTRRDQRDFALTNVTDSDAADDATRPVLDERHTVVLYLQTALLPDPQSGEYRCLIRNSDADLDQANKYEDLTRLKNRLAQFREQNPRCGLLLLLDQPPVDAASRLGWTPSAVVETVASWPEDIANLVVVSASGDGEVSHFAGMGSGGRTAFGHFVSESLTQSADADNDGQITVVEFCDHLVRETQSWVHEHRQTSGSRVVVSPPPDDLNRDDRLQNFVVIKAPPEPVAPLTHDANTELLGTIGELAARQDRLREQLGWRWNPLAWRCADEALRRAEREVLRGQNDRCSESLERAARWLDVSESAAVEQTAEGLDRNRGLPHRWFRGLPFIDRLELSDGDAAAPAAGSGDDGLDRVTVEELLQRHLNRFAFERIGVTPPGEERRETALQRRGSAERAAARAFATASRLQQGLLEHEEHLLRSEDYLFVAPEFPPDDDPGKSAAAFFTAAESFSTDWHRSHTVWCRMLEMLPSAVDWSATAAPLWGPAEEREWSDLLIENRSEAAPTAGFIASLLPRIRQLQTSARPGWQGSAVQLRGTVLETLVHARALQAALAAAAPETGWTTDSLQQATRRLETIRQDCEAGLATIERLTVSVCEGVLAIQPSTRDKQVDQYRRLAAVLRLPGLDAGRRSQVLQRIRQLDATLTGPADSPGRGTQGQDEDAAAAGQNFGNPLWTLQVLNLLPQDDEGTHPAGPAWAAALAWHRGQSDGPNRDAAAGQLGAEIRRLWAAVRNDVDRALLVDADTLSERLSRADTQSRLLPGGDAEAISPDLRNPTRQLDALRRFTYCLLHAERLLASRWVDDRDPQPWHSNGWYARRIERCLEAADAEVRQMEADQVTAASVLGRRTGALRDRLRDSERVTVTARPSGGVIDLGDQNEDRRPAMLQVTTDNQTGRGGVAVLSLRPPSGSDPPPLIQIAGNAVPVLLTESDASKSMTIIRTGNPLTGDCGSIDWQPEVFFRGRVWPSERLVSVSPCEGTKWVERQLARPEQASIVLSDSDSRPIALVLDWSESMTEPISTDTGQTRSVVALATLRDVLAGLEDTRRVSLRVFGHRVKLNQAQVDVPNPLFEEVFRQQIPGRLRAVDDVQLLVPSMRLTDDNRIRIRDILQKLDESKPWGITPLVLGVTRSLQEDLDQKSGIVIVITDGAASDDEVSGRLNDLHRAMRAVKATARLVVVAFDVQEGRARIDELFDIEDALPTSVVDAGNRDQLITVIRNSLDPRLYTVERESLPDTAARSRPLNQSLSELAPADDYIIRFANLSTEDDGLISLDRGDALDVSIDWRVPEFVFDRRSAPRNSVDVAGGRPAGSSTPGMLQAVEPARFRDCRSVDNRTMATVDVSLMLNHPRPHLPVSQPAEIAFHFLPADGSEFRPQSITREFTSEWGAPGWRFVIDDWPEQYDVAVTAQWKMQPTPPNRVLTWTELESAQDPESAKRIGGEGSGLPDATVCVSLREGTLQVRLDPVGGPPDPGNRVDDVTVAVGRRDTFELNKRFLADEVTTRITRYEKGSVIFEFEGQYTAESLSSRDISFTSAPSRRDGALQTERRLQLPRISDCE